MGMGWQMARTLRQSLGGDWKESTEFGPIWGSVGGPAHFQLWGLSHQRPGQGAWTCGQTQSPFGPGT